MNGTAHTNEGQTSGKKTNRSVLN